MAVPILGEEEVQSCPELPIALFWQGGTEVVRAEVWDTTLGLPPLAGPLSAAPAQSAAARWGSAVTMCARC